MKNHLFQQLQQYNAFNMIGLDIKIICIKCCIIFIKMCLTWVLFSPQEKKKKNHKKQENC